MKSDEPGGPAQPIRVNMRALRHVAPQLQPLIARLIQRDPGRRYQTPDELSQALAALPPLETALVDDGDATMAVGRVAFRRRSLTPDLSSTWWNMPARVRLGGLAIVATLLVTGAVLGAAFMFGDGGGPAAPKPPRAIVTGHGWLVYQSDWRTLDDETWETDIFASKRGEVPGGSKVVCLVTECTGEDIAYMYTGTDIVWGEVPGAEWVWAAGVKATDADAADAAYFFEKEFTFDGASAKKDFVAQMTFAFDNGIRVFIDGHENKEGVNVPPGTPQTVDVTQLFSDGQTHSVILWGVNGECETPCTYTQQPAGILVKIEFVRPEDVE